MIWNFAKISIKASKQHHIMCRLRNPYLSLESWTRKYFFISPYIKIQKVLSPRIKNQILTSSQ